MSLNFVKCVSSCFLITKNTIDRVSPKILKNEYVQFTNSSTGILKFYTHLKELGVIKISGEYAGIKLKPQTVKYVEPVVIAAPFMETISNYETELIKIKQAKLAYLKEKEEREREFIVAKEEREHEFVIAKEGRDREFTVAKEGREREFVISENEKNRFHAKELAKMKIDACREKCMQIVQITNQTNINFNVDFNAYGNQQDQYVSLESAKRVIAYEINNSKQIPQIEKPAVIEAFDDHIDELSENTLVRVTPEVLESKDLVDINTLINDCQERKNMKNLITIKSVKIDSTIDNETRRKYIISIIEFIESKSKQIIEEANSNNYTICSNDSMRKWHKEIERKNQPKSMKQRVEYLRSENETYINKDTNEQWALCYCCKKACALSDMHRSHVIAKSLGGSTHPDNIRICCASCNLTMAEMNLYTYMN